MQPRGEYELSPKPVRIGYALWLGILVAALPSVALWGAVAYALLT